MTVRIGTETSGDPAWLDPRAAAAWNAAVPLVELRLGIDLQTRIIQAYGDADASAGTHGKPPAAVDIRTRGLTSEQIEALVALLRECGFAATWFRDWEGNEHLHAATDIGAWTPARYQIVAVKAGFNGLGSGGRGGPDYHPAPSVWRTAQTGAVWALARLEEEMQISDSDKRDIARMAAQEVLAGDVLWPMSDGTTGKLGLRNAIYWLRRTMGGISAKVGAPVDVDEAKIAESLVPAIKAAVEAAGSTDPDVIATAVAKKLGTSLSNA